MERFRRRETPSEAFWSSAIAAILIPAFAVFVGQKAFHELALTHSFDTLPLVNGTIVSSEVKAHKGRKKNTGQEYIYHNYEGIYVYHVNNRRYSNTSIQFAESPPSELSALNALQARYPVGRVIEVHYDPQDPSISALEPGPTFPSAYVMFVGLPSLLTLMCIGLAFHFYPAYKRYKDEIERNGFSNF